MVVVSVVMAVFNGEELVRDAVRSVLTQTFDDLELIVVDDGSSDGTVEVLKEFDDPRMTVVGQVNSGVAPARNRGLAEATGEFVAFIDHDDLWSPDKLATQIAVFDDPRVGLVGSYMTYLGDRGPTTAVAGEPVVGQHDRIAAGRLMPFPLSSLVVRESLIRKLGGFDARLARVAQVEDLDLVARAAREAAIATVDRPLGFYRVHGGAASFRTFHRMRLGTRFVRARIAAEQEGRSLTWEEWQASAMVSRTSLREDRANFLYRTAGHQLVSGRRARGALTLARAAANSPRYVLSRLARQLS